MSYGRSLPQSNFGVQGGIQGDSTLGIHSGARRNIRVGSSFQAKFSSLKERRREDTLEPGEIATEGIILEL
ncbi:hypothetical protein TNCV_4370031 [Trichonephila clavipes]|nr:hypothetical protein TNCV_4370031 [Trichonephila clavipes]